MTGVGAVVGHNDELVGAGPELVLEDEQILAAEADDGGDLRPEAVELLGHGHRDGAAHAAADDADLPDAVGMGGDAQGTDEVLDGLALVLGVQKLGGGADDLEDDLDGALSGIGSGHGQRNALAFLIDPENDELAGLGLPGHHRGQDLHLGHGGVQFFFADDLVHVNTLLRGIIENELIRNRR